MEYCPYFLSVILLIYWKLISGNLTHVQQKYVEVNAKLADTKVPAKLVKVNIICWQMNVFLKFGIR